MLLVGSSAVALGVSVAVWRGAFGGWYFLIARDGVFTVRDWTASRVVMYASECVSTLLPLACAWTPLLLLLRLRRPRPAWRRVWRQPGMAACLAAVVGWAWAGAGLSLTTLLTATVRPSAIQPPDRWVQKFLVDEVFMYVGACVAAAWVLLAVTGLWRRPVDWIDRLGRLVGAAWIVIGLAWTLREYLGFV